MRALFENSPKKDPSTKRRDFLKIEGRSIRVQIIMELEIELLGSQQVLKSRGAKVLPFGGFEDDIENPEQDSIDPTADVIVIAGGSSSNTDSELPRLIGLVALAAPDSKVLAISCIRSLADISNALVSFVNTMSDVIIRSDRINADELLVAVRNLALEISQERDNHTLEFENNKLVEASGMISNLTAREHEILQGVARGFSNKEISKLLGISLRTVNNHAGMLFLKLGVNADSTISARVTAALAYCLFNRLLIGTVESNALEQSGQVAGDSKEITDGQVTTEFVSP